jgi:hypothetical protein
MRGETSLRQRVKVPAMVKDGSNLRQVKVRVEERRA